MKVKLILSRKSLIFYLQKSRLGYKVSAWPTLFYCIYELPLFNNSYYVRVVGNTLYSGGWARIFRRNIRPPSSTQDGDSIFKCFLSVPSTVLHLLTQLFWYVSTRSEMV